MADSIRLRHGGLLALFLLAAAGPLPGQETRVVIPSRGWRLIGDLRLPASSEPAPAVLMLNQAAGTRAAYTELAAQLAVRGIASLRLDLPGHGESTNLGRFVPGEVLRSPMIWDAEVEVAAALEFLRAHPRIDRTRLAAVGGSYSGEEMAESGRIHGYVQAYVALSPGSFSDESIRGIDASGVPWLFIVSRDERYLREITAAVREASLTVELQIVPGTAHASDPAVRRRPGAPPLSTAAPHIPAWGAPTGSPRRNRA